MPFKNPHFSIVNILLLRGKLSLPPGAEIVSSEQLLEYLADLGNLAS